MAPEVSAIIPAFNRRAMLIEAIESAFAQRDARFELIVVDDGSTDGTADAIGRMMPRSPVPMRIIRTENRGVAAARNAAARLSEAPLIAFLDSDDLWAPTKLARQLAYMSEHPESEISQCNELWMRDGRRVNPGLRHLKRAGDIFLDSLRTCLISPSAVIMRTSLFRSAGGFDETMLAAEDYDLWLRVLLTHQVGLLDEALVTRRAGHVAQLSASIPAIDRFRILALAKLLADADLAGTRRAATAEVLVEKCRIYAKGLRQRDRIDEAQFFDRLADTISETSDETSSRSISSLVPQIRQLVSRPVPLPVREEVRG
ncbi:MAG: glycosyltransferase family 2 protein [Candidatus Binataceae bacterium]